MPMKKTVRSCSATFLLLALINRCSSSLQIYCTWVTPYQFAFFNQSQKFFCGCPMISKKTSESVLASKVEYAEVRQKVHGKIDRL